MDSFNKLFISLTEIDKYRIKPTIDPDTGCFYSIPNRNDTNLIGFKSNGTILISKIKNYLT